MALDAVRALCLESPTEGGSQLASVPSELNPAQDALTAAGLFVQNAANSATDKTTLVARSGNDLTLTDANAGTKNLQDLVSRVLGAVGSHQSLAHMQHFVPDGPGDGWASGAVESVSMQGALVQSRAWFTSSAKTQMIYSEVYTYSGPLLATVTYSVYGPTGSLVRAMTDTFSYTGPIATGTTRTWS